MNSNDFDTWSREAILKAALEYRSSSERYRSELVYTESQLARVMGEREQLRDALAELVKINEDHNDAIESILGRHPDWRDAYLDNGRAALQETVDE